MDREVIEAVVIAKDGRVGVCIDICLEISGGIEISNNGQGTEEAMEAIIRPLEPQPTEEKRTSRETPNLLGIEDDNGIGHLSLADKDEGYDRPGGQVNLMD